MDRFLFLKEWEHFSGVSLSPEGRANFLRECSGFMHYGETILMDALHVAKKNKKFELAYVEAVAGKLYQRDRERAASVQPLSSTDSYSFSFSGLSSSLLSLGGGDYYEHRERKHRRRQ
ncbi:MAG: hypothetical protein ACYC1U_04045 [Candidatus Aquicultorales bacterium]